MKKTLRLAAIMMIMLLALTVCAFAMDGPPPDGGGAPPDGGGDMGAAPAAADAAAPADDAGPATGGVALATVLFAVCGVGAVVTVPTAIKK